MVWILAPPIAVSFSRAAYKTRKADSGISRLSQHNLKILDVTLWQMLTSPVLDDKIKIIYKILFITVLYRTVSETRPTAIDRKTELPLVMVEKTQQFFCTSGTLSLS